MNRDHCGLASDLVVDGLWGPGTRNALGTFCSSIGARSDTPLTDGDETLLALRRGLPAGLIRQKLWLIMTSAGATRNDGFSTEGRRVGKESVRTGKTRWLADH